MYSTVQRFETDTAVDYGFFFSPAVQSLGFLLYSRTDTVFQIYTINEDRHSDNLPCHIQAFTIVTISELLDIRISREHTRRRVRFMHEPRVSDGGRDRGEPNGTEVLHRPAERRIAWLSLNLIRARPTCLYRARNANTTGPSAHISLLLCFLTAMPGDDVCQTHGVLSCLNFGILARLRSTAARSLSV